MSSRQAVLATEVLYNPAIACVKFSFLLFFRRVFPGRRFHALLWLVGTIVFIYSWIIIFSAIFQCQPIRATWDMSVKHAKCMKFNVEVVVFAVFNVITDVTILIIPIPILWKLQIPWSKKVQLMAVFLTGILYAFTQVALLLPFTNISRLNFQCLRRLRIPRPQRSIPLPR